MSPFGGALARQYSGNKYIYIYIYIYKYGFNSKLIFCISHVENFTAEDDALVAAEAGDKISSHLCGVASYICHAHFCYYLPICKDPSLITAADDRDYGIEIALNALSTSKAVKKSVWLKDYTLQIHAMVQYQLKALQMRGQLTRLDAGDALDAATAQALHNTLTNTKFKELQVYEEDDMEYLVTTHAAIATPDRMAKLRNFFCAEGSSKLTATKDAIVNTIGIGGKHRIGAMFVRENVAPDWTALEETSAGLSPCCDNVTTLLPLASKLDDCQLKAQLGVIDGLVASYQAAVSFAIAFEHVRNIVAVTTTNLDDTFLKKLAAFLRQTGMWTTFYIDHTGYLHVYNTFFKYYFGLRSNRRPHMSGVLNFAHVLANHCESERRHALGQLLCEWYYHARIRDTSP